MTKTRLFFGNVGEIVGADDLGVITLTDEWRERMITVICDKAMAVQLELRAKNVAITRIMLPEVLAGILKHQAGMEFEILIDDIIEGQYRTFLYNKQTLEPTPIRASDAVLLSLAADIPIYIESRLMQRQSVRYTAGNGGIHIPLNIMSVDMLDDALQKAVDEENYELASYLRDEKNRRHQP